ncbi:DUF2262 domain-containing protein [Dysgonomonas sp. 521]|uniref:DUF2262 domain-containing protein n=1 Tax=Dysgonomonas sp. 521 TaxID=2302932 RepID=UPI0013D254C7|nr:DUF2262 domain-containing protein [Dysgonomonas sp. 521]NDV95706.1 DUF2262 domain-containing protein [Dysgonomonas sp. 521]
MNGWEIKNFTQTLMEAQGGNSKKIDTFVADYPLCAVKADYSQAIILRQFHVQLWEDERRILNCKPDTYGGAKSDEKQWGITQANFDKENGSGSEGSMCIPNYKYTSVTINDDDSITLKWDNSEVTTNLQEMFRKLKYIFGKAKKEEIETAFATLCNEVITGPPPPEVVYRTLESEVLGMLTYNEEYECYQTETTIDGHMVEITVDLTYPSELKKNIKKVDKLMSAKFYEKALQKMAKPMSALKNEVWLGEDEDGQEEPRISADELLKRIKITAIAFDDECEAEIYCDDGDIFWGHCILISTNARGTYQDATLAG